MRLGNVCEISSTASHPCRARFGLDHAISSSRTALRPSPSTSAGYFAMAPPARPMRQYPSCRFTVGASNKRRGIGTRGSLVAPRTQSHAAGLVCLESDFSLMRMGRLSSRYDHAFIFTSYGSPGLHRHTSGRNGRTIVGSATSCGCRRGG
jgi:hypothetical protein